MAKLKSMKKWISMALAMIMVVAMFTGCASPKKLETKETKEITEATETPNTSVSEEAVEAGKSQPAQRIVSGYYITTSACIALGLKDKMVGIEAKADKRPIYKLAAPELIGLPSVGTAKEFDLEGCAALNPDLVILRKKLSEQAGILEGMGMKTLVVNPESMEGLEEAIRSIAPATGTQERAEALIGWYGAKKEKLAGITGQAGSGEHKPQVYIAGTRSILRAATTQMYQNSLIELAGGVNAAADLTDNGWADISYEQLITYDPEVIVVIPEAEYTKEDVLKDGQLAGTAAVQNGRVYEMPSSFEAWDSPVPSGILGCMWLSSVLHEDSYPFDEFREEAAEFYREFYGVEIDPALITR